MSTLTAVLRESVPARLGLSSPGETNQVLIVWGNWGPYHFSRLSALQQEGKAKGWKVTGLELFARSGVYDWKVPGEVDGLIRLNCGKQETDFHPWRITQLVWPILKKLRPQVVFLPSYWHWSLWINFLCRLLGARIVMMNDTHARTARSRGLLLFLKRWIVRSFHAALVAGEPHRNYFQSLGLKGEKIFTGYDCVDNEFFSREAAAVRVGAVHWRRELSLPKHYFLSLGRMVGKKNLGTLIRAYAAFKAKRPDLPQDLVFVGGGELESELMALAQAHQLTVVQPQNKKKIAPPGENRGSVYFYGFQQIDMNPVFYALADAFILPSLKEEWGLVVNEAMACGLPVVVSRYAGCVEDLLEKQSPIERMESAKPILEGIDPAILLPCLRSNGLVFDPYSTEELQTCLEYLAVAEAQRLEMGRRSAELVDGFSCRKFAHNAANAAMAAMHSIPSRQMAQS